MSYKNKPVLPSELHPDYPKPSISVDVSGPKCITYPTRDAYTAFYSAHPEFKNEGHYELLCPYCGAGLSEEHGACCGEYGHAEWTLIDINGEIVEK